MARYTDAIRWIAENDDCDWLEDKDGCISVTACLVADVFGKSEEVVTADLRRAVIKDRDARLRQRNQGEH